MTRAGARLLRLCAIAAAMMAGFGDAAWAQRARAPADPDVVRRLYQDVAYSLFLLTNTGFSSGGYAHYDDDTITAKLNIYSLPLRHSFDTGLFGPMEFRLALAYGEATATSLQDLAGVDGLPAGAVAAERQFLRTWNARAKIGRPIELMPDLVLTPLLGFGYLYWAGKTDRNSVGSVPFASDRINFWADALLGEAMAILEYRRRWGDVNIRPGISIGYTYAGSVRGRAEQVLSSGATARGKADLSASSTLLRAALRIDGPLGLRVAGTDLLWQGFVIGNYETAAIGLFPWSVEIGAAVGANFDRLGRSLLGFDPGEFYIGASYITGENLSGFRVNFGFRF